MKSNISLKLKKKDQRKRKAKKINRSKTEFELREAFINELISKRKNKMGKATLAVIGTGKGIVQAIYTKIQEEGSDVPVNYFGFIEGVGIVRARKTTAISWQLFGVGLKKADLESIVDTVIGEAEIELTLHGGLDYNIEVIKELYLNAAPKNTEESEDPKDKKKKKKKKSEPKVLKNKDLEADFTSKDVAGAMKEMGFKKKKIKKVVAEFETNGSMKGADVLDVFDSLNNGIATQEDSEKIFGLLA